MKVANVINMHWTYYYVRCKGKQNAFDTGWFLIRHSRTQASYTLDWIWRWQLCRYIALLFFLPLSYWGWSRNYNKKKRGRETLNMSRDLTILDIPHSFHWIHFTYSASSSSCVFLVFVCVAYAVFFLFSGLLFTFFFQLQLLHPATNVSRQADMYVVNQQQWTWSGECFSTCYHSFLSSPPPSSTFSMHSFTHLRVTYNLWCGAFRAKGKGDRCMSPTRTAFYIW